MGGKLEGTSCYKVFISMRGTSQRYIRPILPNNPPKKEIHPRPNPSPSRLKPTTCEEINMWVLPVYTKRKAKIKMKRN